MTARHSSVRFDVGRRSGGSFERGLRCMALCGTALAFVACISLPMEWKREDTKPDQVKYDKAVCEYNAEIQAGPVGTLSGEQRAARKAQVKKMSNLCMTSRGYKLEPVPIEP